MSRLKTIMMIDVITKTRQLNLVILLADNIKENKGKYKEAETESMN